MPELSQCKYVTPDGRSCPNTEMGAGYCFWHDPKFDKSGLDLCEKLEEYAHEGNFLLGLKLKRANLKGINLVKRGKDEGYDLSYSDLYRADLGNAHLFSLTLKEGSVMKANLTGANLHRCNFEDTNLLGVKLTGARLDKINVGNTLQQEVVGKQAEKDHDMSKALDNFEQSEEIYRDLRKAAEQQGLFELSGKFAHKELIMRRLQHPKLSIPRISSRFVDLFCGYGEKPLNVISFSMTLIFICSLCYFALGVQADGVFTAFNLAHSLEQNAYAFASCLYFSVVTFTTLGYGDITPIGLSRIVAALEAFSGSFTLALFVVVFVKKMTR
ncbi:MAG: hypothetical protein ACI8WB_005116 [Phenylobacterium sp.]|jgi:hypothetical protein